MTSSGAIKAVLKTKDSDVGGLSVRRALPYIKYRSIGPWVFFDHFGPVRFQSGQGLDVRPHPHINLATVTYLFEGEIFHRDSLGYAQAILPGAINLMVAGKGIVHSERTREELRKTGYDLHGIQLWMALPDDQEETDPAFYHYPAGDIPETQIGGAKIRVLMGAAFGLTSPVKTLSPTLYAEVFLSEGGSLQLPQSDELAIYVVAGGVEIDGEFVSRHSFCVIESEMNAILKTKEQTRLVILGGKPLGRRHLWWNFVSSRKERIEQAKEEWRRGDYGAVPGDDAEFIPLPD